MDLFYARRTDFGYQIGVYWRGLWVIVLTLTAFGFGLWALVLALWIK